MSNQASKNLPDQKNDNQAQKIRDHLAFSNPGKNLQISIGNFENLGKRKTKKRTTYDTTRQSRFFEYFS